MKKNIQENKEETLKKFYRSCFNNSGNYKKFWKNWGEFSINGYKESTLLDSLDYLRKSSLPSFFTKQKSIILIQANQDQIAKPINKVKDFNIQYISGGHLDWLIEIKP
jgi:hypothetical protein